MLRLLPQMVLGLLMAVAVAAQQPVRVLSIGDSQTEEYAFLVDPGESLQDPWDDIFGGLVDGVFADPESNPGTANIMNWVEILADRRASHLTFGSYEPDLFNYLDLRNAGYQFNWGVPGYKASDWVSVINQRGLTLLDPLLDPLEFLHWRSRDQLETQLENDVDTVVIFLGGNDVNNRYQDFYNKTISQGDRDGIIDDIFEVVDWVAGRNANLPIVVVNIPDVGASPNVAEDPNHPDPAKRADASAMIAAMNADLAERAGSRGHVVADVFSLTEQIIEPGPTWINGRAFVEAGHPENPPDHLFARDGFHPSTASQAAYAQEILWALNAANGLSIPRMQDREILRSVLGFDPDQPFLNWIGAYSVGAQDGWFDDPDQDGWENLVEYALGGDPSRADCRGPTVGIDSSHGPPLFMLTWSGLSDRQGYLDFSADEIVPGWGLGWRRVPDARTGFSAGVFRAWREMTAPRVFLRGRVGVVP